MSKGSEIERLSKALYDLSPDNNDAFVANAVDSALGRIKQLLEEKAQLENERDEAHRNRITAIAKCDSRPDVFISHMEARTKELVPNYPYSKNDAFEWLWALTSSLEGARLACGDWVTSQQMTADERDKLQKFKEFVHAYLDQHGVPHGDPTNEHQKAGCRIGARLDLLFAQRDEAVSELKRIEYEERC